ncbi:hypothetical protein GEMRC1_004106 [Eukaryota sp. GEM-RC1]
MSPAIYIELNQILTRTDPNHKVLKPITSNASINTLLKSLVDGEGIPHFVGSISQFLSDDAMPSMARSLRDKGFVLLTNRILEVVDRFRSLNFDGDRSNVLPLGNDITVSDQSLRMAQQLTNDPAAILHDPSI